MVYSPSIFIGRDLLLILVWIFTLPVLCIGIALLALYIEESVF